MWYVATTLFSLTRGCEVAGRSVTTAKTYTPCMHPLPDDTSSVGNGSSRISM